MRCRFRVLLPGSFGLLAVRCSLGQVAYPAMSPPKACGSLGCGSPGHRVVGRLDGPTACNDLSIHLSSLPNYVRTLIQEWKRILCSCLCAYMYVCLFSFVWTNEWMNVCIYVYMYVCMYVCTYVCVHMYMCYICISACACVCTWLYMYMCVHMLLLESSRLGMPVLKLRLRSLSPKIQTHHTAKYQGWDETQSSKRGFPKIRDPNVVPWIVGSVL